MRSLALSEEDKMSEPLPRRGAVSSEGKSSHPSTGEKNGFKKILSLLRSHSGVDFSLYKTSTIQRRIKRRIVLHKLTSLDAYAQFLRGNAKDLDALYADVLINVTSFFRNPEAFDVLKRRVFPKLIPAGRGEPLRVWVPGCSTGQEAYSIGMAFTEFSDSATGVSNVQIFATDLNEGVLNRARAGLYAKTLVQDVSAERLRRFFVEAEGGYRICKPLRDMVVFARQNLLSDPPFSRLHLVSCRNLLIYIEPSLHKKILPTFHYALRPGGFLFLGASEGIGAFTDLFEPVDKNHRIYSKRPAPTPSLHLHFAPTKEPPASKPAGTPEGFDPEVNIQREADRVTVKRHAPPSLLVNGDLQVLQFRGETGPYLKTPTGRPTLDVLKLAREGLTLPLRAAFNKAKKENRVVRRENVPIAQNGQTRRVNIEVAPLKNLNEHCYVIFFEECHSSAAASEHATLSRTHAPDVPATAAAARRRIADLVSELAEKEDYLQSIQEQYDAANEELQAFNEEVTSANEELQSTNEELETSKEELESTNEELTTVNEEMANRNTELSRLNSDLHNLHATLNMAIMVFARDLTIRSFSALAGKLFNLLAPDVGRPLRAVRHNLDLPDLEEFITEVIDTVREREREVQDKQGRWYSLRVRPYPTLDRKVDGAVLVLVDIEALKTTAREIAEARDYAEAVTRTAPNPLIVLSAGLRVQTANDAFYHTFKSSPAETEGRLIYDLGNGQWNIPRLVELLEDILPRNSVFNDLEVTHDFQNIGRRTMLLNARKLGYLSGQPSRILLGIQDITERKRAEGALREAQALLADRAALLEKTVQERTATLQKTIGELEYFSYTITHDMRAPLRAMRGYGDVILSECGDLLTPDSAEYLNRIMEAAGRMDALIQDALQYGKILSGEIELVPVEPVPLLRGILDSYPTLQPPQVEIEIVEPLPPVIANEACLLQCFSNLLANAIKFVEPGMVPQVRVWAETRNDLVRLWFEDNGIGIAPEYQNSIFGMFQQLDKNYEGTGIGLALVRKAAERMGGKIGVQSELGKGSRFWLELTTPNASIH